MRVLAAIIFAIATSGIQAQELVRLYAAGSLRAAMLEIGKAFQDPNGIAVAGTFGASGLLRERIEKGEAADVFASADMGHPQKLVAGGRALSVALFARNRLCALVSPKLQVTPENLLQRMLDPAVKLATSTPHAALSAKALKLSGGPDSPAPPKDRSVYGFMIEKGDADLYLAYCTAAQQAKAEVPGLQIVQIPQSLAVGADYGLTVIKGARSEAGRFAQFVFSPAAQAILEKYGFSGGDAK